MENKMVSKIRLIRQYYTDNIQILKLIEELSELQKELCKYLLKGNNLGAIVEETADVEIMLEQLKQMLVIKNDVILMTDKKVHETLKVINMEQPMRKQMMFIPIK